MSKTVTISYPGTPSWQIPLGILFGLAISSTIVFWLTDLDIRCAAFFYALPPALDPWPQELVPLWRFFFYAAPIFAALLALGALITLWVGRQQLRWRQAAIYVLLTLALGPGLLVNLVFKDHWGRPRPRQIEVFGGTMRYLPPLALGSSPEEKSFPAGHASVGFSLFVFWFLWRRRHPRWAWVALISSIALGLAMGLGRMATGAHFLSDVLWAGFISFFTALVLYYFVIRIPEQIEDANTIAKVQDRTGYLPAIGISLAILGGALLGFPVHEVIDYRPAPELLPLPATVHLDLRQAHLTIILDDSAVLPLQVTGTIQGFGLPTYRINSRAHKDHTGALVYQFKQRGFFTELDSRLQVRLNTSQLQKLIVRLRSGDIQIIAKKGISLPQLDLKTYHGKVLPLLRN